MTGRRIFLTLAGGFVVVAGWRSVAPRIGDLLAGDFEFAPLPRAPGFRKLIRDGNSLSRGAVDPLVGLGADRTATFPEPILPQDLFGAATRQPPVAVFTDYNCPFCRVLERDLAGLAVELDFDINFVNLPLLGDASELGAKASIAAGLQNRFDAMHARLMESRSILHDAYINEVADQVGLDVDQLQRDMKAPAVLRRIDTNRALGRMFGVIGTPGTVIGQTFFAGVLSVSRIRDLIELERG